MWAPEVGDGEDEDEDEVDCGEGVVEVDVASVRHDVSLPVVMKKGADWANSATACNVSEATIV